MSPLEQLPDLDPLRKEHTCPRCGDVWAWREVPVYAGCVVRVFCPAGHRGSTLLWLLPDPLTVTT